MYKFDTHVHTSETSSCAVVEAEDAVKLYIEAGYSGFCITDHYYNWFFNTRPEDSWADNIARYLKGYHNAKQYGDSHGFTVLLGLEIRFSDSPNDYLIYGVTEEFLAQYPKLYDYSKEDFKHLAYEHGILIFQAHPFRVNITRENPLYLDGVEVYNGNPRHNSNNHLALEFADNNGLLHSAGSDFHHIQDTGVSGIMTETRIENNDDFLTVLKSREFEIIK